MGRSGEGEKAVSRDRIIAKKFASTLARQGEGKGGGKKFCLTESHLVFTHEGRESSVKGHKGPPLGKRSRKDEDGSWCYGQDHKVLQNFLIKKKRKKRGTGRICNENKGGSRGGKLSILGKNTLLPGPKERRQGEFWGKGPRSSAKAEKKGEQ